MRSIVRITLIFVCVLLLAMGWGWFNIWRSPKYYTLNANCTGDSRILSMEQYGQLVDEHPRPFIVYAPGVTIFGAEHTKNPDDPQLPVIESEWEKADATVALVEGRLGFLLPYAMNPTEEFGEGGYVAALARDDGALIYTWELPKSDLILELLATFNPEQVALAQILGPYFSNYRFGRPADPEQFVEQYLNRASYPGLNNVISSIEEIDRIWQHDFGQFPDWRETSDQFGLPGYLAEIAEESNLIRNRHLVCVIDELTGAGEKVFVICGLSHAVCVEPAFKK